MSRPSAALIEQDLRNSRSYRSTNSRSYRSTTESGDQHTDYASEYSEDYSYSEEREDRQFTYPDDPNQGPVDKRWESGGDLPPNYAWVRITLDRAEGLRLRENGENPDVVATVRSLSTIPS